MMRVLHLIPDLGLGGAQRALAYLAAATDPARCRLEVAYWGTADDLRKDLEGVGAEVTRLEGGEGSLPRLARALARHLRRRRPDVVHTHLFDADLVGLPVARALGVGGCCATIHSFSFFTTRAHRWRYRGLALVAGRFFPVSQALGEFLVRRCGVPAPRVQVIANGIDAARFAAPEGHARCAAPGPVVGTLARLDPRKGLHVLLEAASRVLRDLPEASFVLGGAGEERAALERRAHALGIAHRVTFVGPVHDPPGFYRHLDLFVLPSLDEGFGLVVLEAMGGGVPVIGTRVGGIPELIEHGRNGLLVEPGDAEAMAAEVCALWADPARREQLGAAARRTALEFPITRTAAQVVAAYEALT